ncbi:SAC3/GANP/Nin1/mts3/eIF-3 p25 family-domain-containing protein [Catenaria anguillulae PL171]|uniref:SAC3/GANP/Nin1/mts3/eIF-3 p25 family-domain-containing protein n=1 Tax=Catenaria anguillulae PL171 TaxID=765915 RepID=A0A1Y2HIY3_9FUNG|nr:SAC3/GANP/Nin1/mts3/eIF-3 p25 family-domain-containing protein [Catenaria anguillulae PL171]
MNSQQQPAWNSAAAAAYYAYATQAAASAPPTTAPAFVGKIGQYWDALPETQRAYFLAAVQNYQPPPATESDRLGLAKLMAFQYYEQYLAQSAKNPAADAATAMAMYQQQVQQPTTSSSSIWCTRQPKYKQQQQQPPPNPYQISMHPTASTTSKRSNIHGVPSDSKVDRKKQMGDFVREMLTLLKASPPACADYVKEKLKPLGHAFLHDANPVPLPSVRAFVTGAIAEYKRQHLLTNPTLSNHPLHGDASSHASTMYGPTRPMTLKPSKSSSSSTSKLDFTSRTSSQPSSPTFTKSKHTNHFLCRCRPPHPYQRPRWLAHYQKAQERPTFQPRRDPLVDQSIGFGRIHIFIHQHRRPTRRRRTQEARARATLSFCRAAACRRTQGGGGGGDDGGFGDDPENEHGDLDDVVVGTSQALEKPFLRLTSAPDPTEVRPLPVLEKALVHLMNRWRESRDYRFMCDQLKSVRQDLLVQRIQNELTVKVYELHARIALEMGDIFCMSEELLGVTPTYRILYFLYTKSRRDMKLLLSTLTPSDRANHYVAQALAVRAAAQRGDYLTFFDLYRNADLLMGTYLLDPMMDRERAKGLWTMTKSHMTVRMDRIVRQLAWDDAAQATVFINRVVDQVCDARCVQPVPKDRSEYKVQEGAEVVEGKKIRVMMEAWLVAFTKVDIKGQLD